MSKRTQAPLDTYPELFKGFGAMPGNKVQAAFHFNKFDYETVKRAYDMWLAVTPKASMSMIVYEFYPYHLVSRVPEEATAFAHRNSVRC